MSYPLAQRTAAIWNFPALSLMRQVSTGAEWPSRFSDSHLLTLHLKHGGLTEVEEGGQYRGYWIPEGSLCVNPSGPVAGSRWATRRELIFVSINQASAAALLAGTPTGDVALQHRIGVFDPQASSLILALAEEAAAGSPSGALFAESLTRALVLRLFAAHGANPPRQEAAFQAGLSGVRLRRVLDRLHGNLERTPDVGELANLAGLSADHFSRAFRRSMGLPPHRYLLQVKIDEAKQRLVAADFDLATLAVDLGFSDQSHFQNVFRRMTGCTPLRYRKERRLVV